MALKYSVKTRKIMDGADEIATVHGLSLNAIVGLINLNRSAVEALFESFSGKSEVDDEQLASLGMDMIESAPIMVAQIIAAATDAYENYVAVEGETTPLDTILDMPVGLQLAFLQEIGELTFAAGGGAKKVLALALKAAQGGSQSGR